jgi:hypothetical protein
MNKATTLVLDEEELLELLRILDDDDAPAALDFLRRHLQAKAHQLLEGG